MLFKQFNIVFKTDLPISKFFLNLCNDKNYDVLIKSQTNIEFKKISPSNKNNFLYSSSIKYTEIFKRGVGKFILYEGKKIYYAYEKKCHLENFLAFLMTSVMAFLMHQRQFLVLHASSGSIDGKSFFLCGRSFSGKSTLLSKLIDEGTFLSDDITLFHKTKKMILNGPNILKVDHDIKISDQQNIFRTQHDIRNRKLINFQIEPSLDNKFKIGFFLKIGKKNNIQKIEGIDVFKNILANSYRSNIASTDDQKIIMSELSRIMQGSNFFILTRRNDSDFELPLISKLISD